MESPVSNVLRVPATLTGLHDAADSLRRLLETRQLPDPASYNVELVFEEIVANIVRHGQPTSDIDVAITFGDAETILIFEDDGVPFNPREHTPRPAPTSLDEVQVGGLGIALVKKIASRMDYERTEDRNRLLVAIPAR
jgi:serine/threonine-protein kinase RsbW